MAPKLFYMDLSPPARSVLMTAKALGLELELKEVNLAAGEHMTPEFLKMNPQHTVPTLDDAGFYLWDSHAIITYLTNKYGKDESLYPKDLKKRAIVEQRLHFNSGTVFPRMRAITFPIFRQGATTVPDDKIADVKEAYGFLETFLEGNKWVCGNDLTIADLSLIPTITSLNVVVPVSDKEFPKIAAWLKNAESLPGYKETNATGLMKLAGFLKSKLGQ